MGSVTSNPSTAGTLTNRAQGLLTIRIEPPRKCFESHLKELCTHRGLLYSVVWRDVKVRYKQTAIGVCAFHQNHDYGYHPEGRKGVWESGEAQGNYALLDRHRRFRTLDNAKHLLKPDGMRWNYRAWRVPAKRDAHANFLLSGFTFWIGLGLCVIALACDRKAAPPYESISSRRK
jgi:hypothetical protein